MFQYFHGLYSNNVLIVFILMFFQYWNNPNSFNVPTVHFGDKPETISLSIHGTTTQQAKVFSLLVSIIFVLHVANIFNIYSAEAYLWLDRLWHRYNQYSASD